MWTPALSTVTLTNFTVADKGTDGLATGTTILSLATYTANMAFGNNFDTDQTEYAYAASNVNRGVATLDNITVIPKPSSWGLAILGLGVILVLGNRRSVSSQL